MVALLLLSIVAAVRGCVAVSVAGPAVGPAVRAAGGRGSCRVPVLRLAWCRGCAAVHGSAWRGPVLPGVPRRVRVLS